MTAELGAASLGLWTRAQALAVISRGRVDRLVAQVWQSPYSGVYADGGYELTAEQWALAGVLASGGADQPVAFGTPREDGTQPRRLRAAACGRDAARVWDFPLIDDDDPATGAEERFLHDVHVWGRGLSRLPGPATATKAEPEHAAEPESDAQTDSEAAESPSAGAELEPDAHAVPDQPPAHELRRHRLTLRRGDMVRRDSGLYVTSELRTALDCVQLLTHEAAVCLLDDGLHRELFSEQELLEAAAQRSGQAGSRRLAAAVAAADGRAESPAETLARLLLLPALPSLVPQVKVRDRTGRVVARIDLGDKSVKLAVELDGKKGHAGDRMVAKDQRRDRTTEGLGWATERGVWYDVRRRQLAFVQRVAARHATRPRAA